MKILLTESQLKLITENYRNDSIIKMGLKDGDIMVKYKVWDYDNEKDNIFVDTYENFCVEVDLPKNDVVGYLKSKNLNLGNSRLVKELIRKEPKESDYFEFHRDENGKFYPEAFLGDYENYCGNDRECQNGVLRTASRVLNIVYKSEYPIVVYRGVKPNEKFDKHTHPGGYWTTKLSVAQGFGSVVYKGLIHKPEDIMILHTMENRMRWPEEFELSSHKVEIVEKYVNNVKEVMGLTENTNSHLVEVIPNRYVYHTSNPIFRDRIKEEGLIPKGKSETWLSNTNIDGKIIFAVNSDDKEDWWDSTYDDDIYKIDTTELKNKWYVDPNFYLEDKRIITFENIPPNSIKLIYRGIGSDSLNKSINIENPSTDEYNDIIVNDEKVGYIILSPARKEYYWLDINLPNPLAIVEIKILNQFRGKNYMKETINWLYNFAKENGYKSLFLRVDDDSEISQDTLFKIYQKYGFSVYRTTDDEDDVFMYKLI